MQAKLVGMVNCPCLPLRPSTWWVTSWFGLRELKRVVKWVVGFSLILYPATIHAQPVYNTWTTAYMRASSSQNQWVGSMGDGTGAVYTLCNTLNTNNASEISVFKADIEGRVVWAVSFTNDPDVIASTGHTIHVRGGQVAVCASLLLDTGFTNAMAGLISDTGAILWTRRHAPSSGVHYASSVIHLQPNGRIMLGGSAGNSAFLAAYDPVGDLLWHVERSASGGIGASTTTNVCLSLQSDDNGHGFALVRSRYWRGIPQEDRVFWTYDAAGGERWGLGAGMSAFCVEPGGAVYGAFSGFLGVMKKFDTNGVALWTNTFGAGINQFQQNNNPRQVHLSRQGGGVICASQYFNGKHWRYSAARFSEQGDRLWDYIDDPHQLNGYYQLVNDSALDNADNLVLVGNQSIEIITATGSRLMKASPPEAVHVSPLGALDFICALNANNATGQEVRLVRLTRFPAYSPSLFGVYDQGLDDVASGRLRLTVPSTNGLVLRGEMTTNPLQSHWSPLPETWIGTSVITTVILSNDIPHALIRMLAEPPP